MTRAKTKSAEWLVLYEPDMIGVVSASLLVREVTQLRGESCARTQLGRLDDWKTKKEEILGTYTHILVLGSIADIHGLNVADSFPEATVYLTPPKKIDVGSRTNVIQFEADGEHLWTALESIIKSRLSNLSLLTYFLSGRATLVDIDKGEHVKSYVMSVEGMTTAEKILNTSDIPIHKVRSEGKSIHDRFLEIVRGKVEAGRLIEAKVSIEEADGKTIEKKIRFWLFESEKSILDGIRIALSEVRLPGGSVLAMCKYTKGMTNRVFFTIGSSQKELHAGNIAKNFGGGGGPEFGGWNVAASEADKWLKSL